MIVLAAFFLATQLFATEGAQIWLWGAAGTEWRALAFWDLSAVKLERKTVLDIPAQSWRATICDIHQSQQRGWLSVYLFGRSDRPGRLGLLQ